MGTMSFAEVAAAIRPLDGAAMAAARARHDRLTKPPGSLGRLEAVGVHLAGIAGACPPPVPAPAAVAVFAGDHGVVAEGVTAWPSEVTVQMVANFAAGGAAVNVLARAAGARVVVVDVGVAAPLPAPVLAQVWARRIRPGTANLAKGPAMTPAECEAALEVGASVAAELVAGGARALVTGEMGIGNTTAAAALIAAWTGRPAAQVVGPGAGLDDARLAHKIGVVAAALELHRDAIADGPRAALAALGGLEIAALAGFCVGGAAAGVPVVVDGVIADAALLAAEQLAPGTAARCLAGHRSSEPGASAALAALGMDPLLDLGLRLGEGSGACLALPVIVAAARILGEMATFGEAGVSGADPD
jgi:nicotinate-nucleotide--dimethylbenzimidazole phosphoribosyltransferase